MALPERDRVCPGGGTPVEVFSFSAVGTAFGAGRVGLVMGAVILLRDLLVVTPVEPLALPNGEALN